MNNSIGGVKNRRARTLQRLENQLKTNGHPLKHYLETEKSVYDYHVARINKEIAILKIRV